MQTRPSPRRRGRAARSARAPRARWGAGPAPRRSALAPGAAPRARAALVAATLFACGALFAAAFTPGPARAEERYAPGDHRLAFEDMGRARFALVHVPPAAREGKPLPVVLAYHGGGGGPEGMADLTGLDGLADREGFVAVYPAGTGVLEERLLTWNAGGCCGYAREHRIDDVGFTVRLLRHLAARTPVDRTRVYATGLSNGAMMAYRLAAEAPERIAAIAPVAGAMILDSPALATLPVPVVHIHSVDDPRALYGGGLGPPFPLTRHRVDHRPVEDGLAYWARRNGCPAEPSRDPPRSGRAGTSSAAHTAERVTWGPGAGGAEVVLWKLTGAGHVWPGGKSYARERIQGAQSDVIDANEEIWRFLRRFARPEAPALEGDGAPE